MSTLFLIRHGLTAQTGKILYGQTPGRASRRTWAARRRRTWRAGSAPVRLTALYSSPLERCVETVAPLAEAARDSRSVERTELIEMDAGAWTGQRLPALRRKKAEWSERRSGSPPPSRSPAARASPKHRTRVVREVGADRAAATARGRVAIATHGDIVRIAAGPLPRAPLDGFQRFVVDTGLGLGGRDAAAGVGHVLLLMNDDRRARAVRRTATSRRGRPPRTMRTEPESCEDSAGGPRRRRPDHRRRGRRAGDAHVLPPGARRRRASSR